MPQGSLPAAHYLGRIDHWQTHTVSRCGFWKYASKPRIFGEGE